ncbi:MAG: DUF2029 domain-containing protein [Phycisphaeraceae bacterium]|nr:DUF2029 domain-containing protein [Phycisphaeraceae bacterium]
MTLSKVTVSGADSKLPIGPDGGPRGLRGWQRVGLWVFVLAAGLVCLARGPVRAGEDYSDFALIYAQARTWLAGGNPYAHAELRASMQEAGVAAPATFERARWPALYPPATYPVMALVAWQPYGAAKILWEAINLAGLWALMGLLLKLAGVRLWQPAGLLGVGAVLAFTPIQNGLARGQLSLLAVTLGLLALFLDQRWRSTGTTGLHPHPALSLGKGEGQPDLRLPRQPQVRLWTHPGAGDENRGLAGAAHSTLRDAVWHPAFLLAGAGEEAPLTDVRGSFMPLLAGGVMGLALVLKPQIAVVFWLWGLCRGRWRMCVLALGVAMILMAVGIGRMGVRDVPWLESLRQNVVDNSHGGSGDPTVANVARFQLLNLHYPLHTLVDSRAAVNGLVLAAAGLPCVAAAWRARGRRSAAVDLLLLGVISGAALLAAYHRLYDAVLLLPGLAILARLWRADRVRCWAALILLATFLTPGAALLTVAAERLRLPASITEGVFWQLVVLPHQTWAVLLLMLIWLSQLWRCTRQAE